MCPPEINNWRRHCSCLFSGHYVTLTVYWLQQRTVVGVHVAVCVLQDTCMCVMPYVAALNKNLHPETIKTLLNFVTNVISN